MHEDPGWKRLWRHSYAIGLRWLVREARHGWPAGRVGFVRLATPLDPRRYYELGRIADADFDGRCLDVSSPKLLPSLLDAEGRGTWVCVDLFAEEIAAWRTIDPSLDLRVEDATALSFPDESFDHCLCVSVVEHIGGGKDADALSEFWRVLKPGGSLHLTTDVAARPRDVYVEDHVYGQASTVVDERGVFYKHDYTPLELEQLVARRAWEVLVREFATARNPNVERWYTSHLPWTTVAGPFLRFVCPSNFETSTSPTAIESAGEGVAYLQLRKPAGRAGEVRSAERPEVAPAPDERLRA
jgi:SAM-dependent methyltransferase